MALPYLDLIPPADQASFESGLRTMASKLGGKPEWYAITMYRESGMKPTARNAQSGATGLIQFMPDTARTLKTTTDALSRMSALHQLPYVEAYYRMQIAQVQARPASLVDVYLLTLYPKAVGKPGAYVVFRMNTVAYRQNKSIKPQGGDITVTDIAQWVSQAVPAEWASAKGGLLIGGLTVAGFLIYVTTKFLK